MKNKRWLEYNCENIRGKYLYKFLSTNYLEKFLNNQQIWFANAATFGDKMECVTIEDLRSDKLNLPILKSRQEQHFISCWHLGTKESLSLWDTYAKTDETRRKIAIRFNRDDLIKCITNSNYITDNDISKLIYGRIKYQNLIDLPKEKLKAKKIPHISLRKEYVFKYENEFRFVIKLNQPSEQKGISIKIDCTDIDYSILINPLLTNEDYNNLRDKLLKGKFKDRIHESKLAKWLNPI